jgi:hypothetical protein
MPALFRFLIDFFRQVVTPGYVSGLKINVRKEREKIYGDD